MTASAERLHRSVLLLTAGMLFAAALLRSLLSITGDGHLVQVLVVLSVWLVLFVVTGVLGVRVTPVFPVVLIVQTFLLALLIARVASGDYYAVLFGVMSMQVAQRLGWRTTLLWIVLFTLVTGLALSFSPGVAVPEAVAFAVVYAGLDCFLAAFTLVARRAEEARERNRILADELAAANRETEAWSRQEEALAAAEERHRLARELHDSVTQTVFSMNLTAQSAALLLPRDGAAATAQLNRLEELGRSALAEIGALGSELGVGDADDLAARLRRHVAGRELPHGLVVTLEVDGEAPPQAATREPLSADERHALFRIAQEALNNVVKHARAGEARVRLRLEPPRRLEIVDDGVGCDPLRTAAGGGMGLGGMRDRAREIGWSLRVESAPARGTSVVVEEGRSAAGERTGEGRTEP